VAKAQRPQGDVALVVDHDELVRWSVAEGLKEHGYGVRLAADGGEALRCPEASVAIIDHDLPRADGFATAAGLRRLCPGCAVVLMCPDPSPLLRRRARERGIDSVLEKPFSLEALLEAVGGAMQRGHDRSPPAADPGGVSGEVEKETVYTATRDG
jgi:DNA-binding response OmpR family regulator